MLVLIKQLLTEAVCAWSSNKLLWTEEAPVNTGVLAAG